MASEARLMSYHSVCMDRPLVAGGHDKVLHGIHDDASLMSLGKYGTCAISG